MTTIIEIDNVLVSSEILEEFFLCDLLECHGSCCIIGDSGAPLSEEECVLLGKQLTDMSRFLRPEGVAAIKEQGAFVKDYEGDLVTPLINGKECAYTVFDDAGNCLCGIESAYRSHMSAIRKPISCWLYPIRISKLSNGMTALNLHRWHICRGAFAKGKKGSIPVYRFLKEPIIETFGTEFYEALSAVPPISISHS